MSGFPPDLGRAVRPAETARPARLERGFPRPRGSGCQDRHGADERGVKSLNRPKTSSETRICPSQAGSPMPIVGISKATVIAAATGSSVPSGPRRRPASAMDCASRVTCCATRRSSVALKPPACSRPAASGIGRRQVLALRQEANGRRHSTPPSSFTPWRPSRPSPARRCGKPARGSPRGCRRAGRR